jgi:hypothetical protein
MWDFQSSYSLYEGFMSTLAKLFQRSTSLPHVWDHLPAVGEKVKFIAMRILGCNGLADGLFTCACSENAKRMIC